MRHRLASLLSHLLRRVGGRSGPAAAADGVVTHQVTDSPELVTDYWTDERLRAARPRQQRLDPPAGLD